MNQSEWKYRLKTLTGCVLALALFFGSTAFAGCASNTGSSSSTSSDDLSRFESAQMLLEEIWNQEEEDSKPSIIGGLSDEISEEQPLAISLKDVQSVSSMLNVPADLVEGSEDAACMMNAMMANAFTVSAWQLKEDANADDLISQIETALHDTQWMCTFPEEYLIACSGRFVVVGYGYKEQLDPFADALKTVMPNAKITENPIE